MTSTRQGNESCKIAWLVAVGLWLLALVPRLVGLGGFLTIDEIKWIEGAGQFTLALQSGDLARTYWHFFPGITTTWGETVLLCLGWLTTGGDLASYVAAQVADPARTIGFFRLSGALLTAMFAPGVYLLGRRFLGRWAASLAGALVALDPFLLAHSRIVNGDAGAAGLMLLSLLAFLPLWQGGGLQMAALSGALGGLALLTKLPAPLIVPFIVLLAVVGWWRDRRAAFWVKAAGVWVVVAVVVFIALWPAMWVNPIGTLQAMARDTFAVGEAGEGHSAFYLGQIVDDPGWGFYPYAVASRLTPVVVVGLLLLTLALVRVGRREQSPDGRLLVVVLLAYLLFIYVFSSLSPKKLDRYVMAIFPALDVLAALGYAQLIALVEPIPRSASSGQALFSQGGRIGVWLLVVGVLAAAFVMPHYPYYLSYYNPLLGGAECAVHEIPVGWGEGLEQAAAWLNAQPEAATLRVAAWYSDAFFPYFRGRQVSFSSSGKSQLSADYVVFYVNQVQRQKPYPAMVRYFQEQDAAYTVLVTGVPWAWVYHAPGMQVPMPGQVEIEGRAELLGVDLPSAPVHAGQPVAVRLYLRTLGAMPEHEAWQVALVSQSGQPALSGRGRTAAWSPDAIVVQDIPLQLPQDLPAGVYDLEVSLWDEGASQEVARFPIPASAVQLSVVSP
jgi:4-amino-4-deoxy-L-arabinose transferase-like glycosyltransferase